MDNIFDKVGTKVGETFQTIKDSDVTKKAINYAEIPGLQIQIGKQEGIIKKAYQQLGEEYYKQHKDDTFDNMAPTMETITEALEKIENLKAEIEGKKSYDPSKDSSQDVASAEETAKTEVIVESTPVEPENADESAES